VFSNDDENGNTLNLVIKHTVLDSLLDLESIDWSDRYKKKEAAEEKQKEEAKGVSAAAKASPKISMRDAEGTYSHAAYGAFVLRQFDLEESAGNDTIDPEDAQAIISWIDQGNDKVQVPYGLLKTNKLFAQYMLLSHDKEDTYDVTMLNLVRQKETGKRLAIGATEGGKVNLVKDGLAFCGNFYGAVKEQARPLADPAKGEVYFQRVA
jgi:hypothetical protein